ncbi:MAG TPA: YggT family protein [Haloplasmataceae bacterium]
MKEMVKLGIGIIVELYSLLLFIYIIAGYFPNFRDSRFYDFLCRLFEPALEKLDFLRIGPISFAPMALILLLQLFIFLLNAVW